MSICHMVRKPFMFIHPLREIPKCLLKQMKWHIYSKCDNNKSYPQWTRGHTVLHHRFAILRRYCHLAYPSTPRSSALQNRKSEMQNSFGPQPPNFGGWQGNGWRRTGCTPTDVNAASRQKTVVEACVPLSTEGNIS